jgi:uncharacterized protein
MFDLQGFDWWVAAAGALLLGVSKTGMPGSGIVAIPLFAAIIPAKASTGVVLPMLILGDLFAVAWYRRHAKWRHLVRLIPWTMAGVLAGYFMMDRLSDAQLRPMIGVVILGMLALTRERGTRDADTRTDIPTSPAFAASTGLLAGATTMMANAAGPVMTIYLLAKRLPKAEFMGTGAWFFFVMNIFKVPFSAHLGLINRESLMFNAILAPVIGAGAVVGFMLARRIPQKPFNTAARLLAAAGALKLLLA